MFSKYKPTITNTIILEMFVNILNLSKTFTIDSFKKNKSIIAYTLKMKIIPAIVFVIFLLSLMDCIQLLIYVILLYEEYYTSFINYFNLIDFLRLIISIDATANIAITVSETPIISQMLCTLLLVMSV